MACLRAMRSGGLAFGSTSAHDQREAGTSWKTNRKKRKRNKSTERTKEKREGSNSARGSQRVAAATRGHHWALVCVL